jgi:hypothetical protein
MLDTENVYATTVTGFRMTSDSILTTVLKHLFHSYY